jgi:hypothetical protein
LLIPVFFLACCQVTGQGFSPHAESSALGLCYATRSGVASSGLNQAGLGRTDKNRFALHHARPFITTDLDIVSLSVKLSLNRGGPGFMLSTMGIKGMRQTSAWISYGLMLYPRLFAGAGIHLQHTGIAEDAIHHLAAGYALGLQFMVNNELLLGAHVKKGEGLMITSGLAYFFYKTAWYHTEFHVASGKPVQWSNGLEIIITDSLLLLLGVNNQPWSLSAGISMKYRNWGLCLACSYCMDTGTTPRTSLSYEW